MSSKNIGKNIGIPGVEAPTKVCENDENCPFHGSVKLRGRIIKGKVVSTKMQKTIVIERNYNYYIPKYQRYERRRSSLSAHLPDCISVKVGDNVKVAECRKLSKTVSFIVIDNLSKDAI